MNSFNGELIESGVRVSISHGLFRVWETFPQFSKGETYTVDEAVAYANGNYETLPRSLLKELGKELDRISYVIKDVCRDLDEVDIAMDSLEEKEDIYAINYATVSVETLESLINKAFQDLLRTTDKLNNLYERFEYFKGGNGNGNNRQGISRDNAEN